MVPKRWPVMLLNCAQAVASDMHEWHPGGGRGWFRTTLERQPVALPIRVQAMVCQAQAADQRFALRPWAMEFGMGTNQIAGGHGRWNLEWGQIDIAGCHGRWNFEWGQIKSQAAVADGTWNGDRSNCRRPWTMGFVLGTNQIACCSKRRWGGNRRSCRLEPRRGPQNLRNVAGAATGHVPGWRPGYGQWCSRNWRRQLLGTPPNSAQALPGTPRNAPKQLPETPT